jgi:CheY-like chemotaxis protein
VLKHSRPSTVTVTLRFHSSALEVEIEDDGTPSAPTQPGHGILGMRERVAAGGFRQRPAADRRPGMTIRILIADDQELVRTGLRLVLQAYDDLDVIAETADGRQARDLTETQRPDVVLMDIRMPRMDGIEAVASLSAADLDPPPRVLMLTTFDLDEYVFGALRAGAAGFLLKDAA